MGAEIFLAKLELSSKLSVQRLEKENLRGKEIGS